MSSSKIPTKIDQYLCNNRYLSLKLTLSNTLVEVEPRKCNFIVSLYNGYILEKQIQCNTLEETITYFKQYCDNAFDIDLNKFKRAHSDND